MLSAFLHFIFTVFVVDCLSNLMKYQTRNNKRVQYCLKEGRNILILSQCAQLGHISKGWKKLGTSLLSIWGCISVKVPT